MIQCPIKSRKVYVCELRGTAMAFISVLNEETIFPVPDLADLSILNHTYIWNETSALNFYYRSKNKSKVFFREAKL